MEEEVQNEEEPAGSYSPQLLHGDEDEDEVAIDPEVDKAILVICLSLLILIFMRYKKCWENSICPFLLLESI